MRIHTHKQYEKSWKKLPKKWQERAIIALTLFLDHPQNPKLRLHQLKGEFYPQYSISVGGDLRIHFQQTDSESIILMDIGTHSQLYGK